ncbi:MAG: methylenetetrahydrofolate--tRNA-(uracil(54)-C(5))-methyltransferase (FADH(2)-oxidizing) TrmFO [bacterium]|nr:methylenetetrahydrofolate--tRNA-(uracil(54)-C(5))-methyltransferase (FADH(2)-oxidizing) TrmFO [bacterium]
MSVTIHVIGGGLAGCEAAWQIALGGGKAVLHEMRPHRTSDAHRTDTLAELVCSNSFRSDDAATNAVGLLHEELRRAGSLIMAAADRHQVPAGSALAVDRQGFSRDVEKAIESEPMIEVRREEVPSLPGPDEGLAIVATGPLTAPDLAADILRATDRDALAFFDAIAPVVHRDSIDFDIAWFQSRYDRAGPAGDTAAYINCPLTLEEYDAFVDRVCAAEVTPFRDWERETPWFEGCLPIEVLARRGRNTLRFGPMKPVGLTNPATGQRPFAVVQLRQDNALGTLFNMVGFQTKMRHGDQVQVLRTIPGLNDARFARLGGVHRNTFINSPHLLDGALRLRQRPHLRFAGQITGVEGYVESTAIGLLAGRFALLESRADVIVPPPASTALGALLNHVTTGADARTFQPMNCNFGLFPSPGPDLRKAERRSAIVTAARAGLGPWLAGMPGAGCRHRVGDAI